MALKRYKGPSGTLVVLEHTSNILKGNPLRDPHVRQRKHDLSRRRLARRDGNRRCPHQHQRPGTRSDAERIRFAFAHCLSRAPTSAELDRLVRHLRDLRTQTLDDGLRLTELQTWTDVASVLLNLHEFITRD